MKVREIMSCHGRPISSSAMLREASDRMRRLDVSALPVIENHQIVGVITDRDLAVKAAAAGLDPTTTPIREVMTTDVACCSEADDVEEAARTMDNHQVRRLVVLGPDHQAIGIVSVGDLALKTGDEYLAQEVREEIRGPAGGHRP
jgi:CBS domain-containing protein